MWYGLLHNLDTNIFTKNFNKNFLVIKIDVYDITLGLTDEINLKKKLSTLLKKKPNNVLNI